MYVEIHLSYNEGHNVPTNFSQHTTSQFQENIELIKIFVLHIMIIVDNYILPGFWNKPFENNMRVAPGEPIVLDTFIANRNILLFENRCQNSLKELGHYAGHDHHGDTPEYHVFHVEFERVEIPFIIALWIFVSSLAKIGK